VSKLAVKHTIEASVKSQDFIQSMWINVQSKNHDQVINTYISIGSSRITLSPNIIICKTIENNANDNSSEICP
jgi:hypothetical protein